MENIGIWGGAVAPTFTDTDSLRWFASLDEDDRQTSVRAAVAGEIAELDLSCSRITHIPEGVFSTLTVLTTLNMDGCESLTALPESLGQLRALTKLCEEGGLENLHV